MRSHVYLKTAQRIIESYKGDVPFTIHLKNHFREDKKAGSKDRKIISHLCYSWYRLGSSLQLPFEERILAALFLCSFSEQFVLSELKPEWNEFISSPPEAKRKRIGLEEVQKIFPMIENISQEFDRNAFSISHLHQPHTFLRIRPGAHREVLEQLDRNGLDYRVEENCIALQPGINIEEYLHINRKVVVQDKSSQEVLQSLPDRQYDSVWDCCAASGGKSLLLVDNFKYRDLTVTDIRESILYNLQKRFTAAGVAGYQAFVHDLARSPLPEHQGLFDLIICDAPCSGSGTWGRTPERLTMFDQQDLDHYSRLQKSISLNATKSLNKEGYFVYITCSVYRQENEEVLEYLQKNSGLKLLTSQYILGYQERADSLFTALFQL